MMILPNTICHMAEVNKKARFRNHTHFIKATNKVMVTDGVKLIELQLDTDILEKDFSIPSSVLADAKTKTILSLELEPKRKLIFDSKSIQFDTEEDEEAPAYESIMKMDDDKYVSDDFNVDEIIKTLTIIKKMKGSNTRLKISISKEPFKPMFIETKRSAGGDEEHNQIKAALMPLHK
jgi:hypothetical protein